ncbi:MAG: chromosome segregation protein SMC, partial [Candidatus Dadabacteria bacterium]|nr:chromosome segregation protein SMC [Candidatus Dadabacteria bacterium]NIQ14956.1 chromosome segregation protein SMC [Candidatus Dadabacteria bacterium]
SVESFITAKPEEKRKLIEEVAGIVKYKVRRKETQSRIESTKENLTRILDMKNEVFTQMETLSKQAEQAEEYKKLTEESNLLEINILKSKLDRFNEKKSQINKQLQSINEIITKLEADKNQKVDFLSENELNNNKLNSEYESLEKEIYDIKSILQEKNSHQAYVSKEVLGIDQYIEKLNTDIKTLKLEVTQLEQSKIGKTEEIEKLKIKKSSIHDEIIDKEERLNSERSESETRKSELEQTSKNIYGTLNQQSSLKSTASAFTKEIEDLVSRKELIGRELITLQESSKDLQGELSVLQSEELKIKEEFEIKNDRKQSLDSSLYDLRIVLEKKSGELGKFESRKNDCKARIDVLNQVQSNYEWLPESTREFVLSKKGNGVLGVISDFVIAPQNYEKAVEAAFGEKLNWIVVQENQEAVYAIESLRESSVGRGTFIPVKDRIHNGHYEKNGHQVQEISNFVNVNGIDKEFVDSILHGVFIASDLKDALTKKSDLGNGACFATLQGDYIDSTGAITGGYTSGGVFERKREIEELDAELKELDLTILNFQQQKNHHELKIRELEANSKEMDEELRQLEIKSVENIKDQSNLKSRNDNVVRQIDNLVSEEQLIKDKLSGKNQRIAEIEELLRDLEEKKVIYDQKFKEFEQQVLDFQNKEKVLEQDITKLKIENASISEKEKSLNYEVYDIDKRKSVINNKISVELKEIEVKNEEKTALFVSKEQATQEMDSLSSQLLSKENILQGLKEKRNLNRNQIESVNSDINKLNNDIEIQREKLKTHEIEHGGLNVEIQHLRDQYIKIKDENFADISSDDIKMPEDFSVFEAEKQFRSIKRKINSFGLVNLLAPEEFKKLDERHTFLQEQTDDLEQALESLSKAIRKLDRESITKFKEAFDVIDKKFRQIFSRLFDGGEGKLIITNPDDILQTGIDVMIKPKGKRFQSINLLSGGEKALSAIALIISACFVKPLPFLLFDEIDAPLDEINTVRFAKLLNEISDESQVVLITHNKRTMQEVDSLIGITSDRSVTSKVVSVELH